LSFQTSSRLAQRLHYLNFRFPISKYFDFKKEKFYFLTLCKFISNIYF